MPRARDGAPRTLGSVPHNLAVAESHERRVRRRLLQRPAGEELLEAAAKDARRRADVLVAGSAIFRTKDYAAEIRAIRTAATSVMA